MADYAFGFTVRVRRGGGNDRMGDAKPYSYHTIDGCVKWPKMATAGAASTEVTDYSQQVASGYALHVPAGGDLLETDEVLLPGEPQEGPWWQVEGEVLPWGPSPFTGREPGALAALVRHRG